MSEKLTRKILYVSSEVAPYAKTGGLADVAGSLPKALAARGHDIRIVLPRYKVVQHELETLLDFPLEIGGRKETVIVRRSFLEAEDGLGIPVYFIDNYQYFDRTNIYVHPDEAERYAFFCRAVLEMLPEIDFKPDIIHCNDWQSGPICALLKENYQATDFYGGMASLITVHNLHYQGNFGYETLELLGLPRECFTSEGAEFYGQFSFIKAGLVYADVINTVSKTYAEEIKTPEFGEKLEGLLSSRANDLLGIVNGIDPEEYNPAIDEHIYAAYGPETVEKKLLNKGAIQKKFGLPAKDVPVVGLISRLVSQKGLDLITEVFDSLMDMGIQFLVLGSGDPFFEEFFVKMQETYPEQMGVYIGFNEVLAKEIYAGADMFLMPSKFEPCGLGQLMALRYGTIPVVRATGGLADTITDYNRDTGEGNGFSFKEYSGKAMLSALEKALRLFREDSAQWSALVKKALEADFSWAKAAVEYEQLYERAYKRKNNQ